MSVTDETLKAACGRWPDFPRLEGIRELEHEYCLGLLHVHKTEGYFRFGWAMDTSPTSRFIKRRMDFPEAGIDAWGVVFRPFDRFEKPDDPPEFIIGWVPFAAEEELDGWIEFLNEELMKQRQQRIDASGDLPASGAGADSS